MITKNLQTQTGEIILSIPENLNELTLGVWVQWQEKSQIDDLSDLEVISILTDTPLSQLRQVKRFKDLDVLNDRIFSLIHQLKYEYSSNNVPESVVISGKTIKVPKDLSIEPVGAFFECRDLITEEINKHQAAVKERAGDDENVDEDWRTNIRPSAKSSALILANYFYCPVTGNDYDENKAESFVSEIYKMPINDSLPIAAAFFFNYPNL